MGKVIQMPTDVSIIVTYRCPMKCKMCNIWEYPTNKSEELSIEELKKLPKLNFINITGGEPFVRDDIEEIVELLYTKAQRIVISTSGFYEEKVIKLAKRFPNIGIRISIEGMSQTNDHLRGVEGGYDKGIKTLLELKRMGLTDIGFGQTISNHNSKDLLPLYELAKSLGMEFATAAFHNSYYFHKHDNEITNKKEIRTNFEELIKRLLNEKQPKSWFRAFFNLGLINYIEGGKRLLPCEAGTVNFFIDPFGEMYPCNGLEEKFWKKSMGNIKLVDKFEDIWFSKEAEAVRHCVNSCPKNCWMVGTAAPVMKKYIKHPALWVVKNKLKSLRKKPICLDIPYFNVGQNPKQGDMIWPRN